MEHLGEHTRRSGRSDGEQGGDAERSTQKVSRESLRGIQRAGGAKGKRSVGAGTKEAYADQVGRRKGKGKDHAKVGGVKSKRSMVWRPRLFFLRSLLIVPVSHRDEATFASSRMAQEVGEAMSESSWTALAKGKERDWWSIDLAGEVEKLEERDPWSGTKGDSVEQKGEMGHKLDRTKVTREETEKLKEDEMEVEVDAPQGESVETKSSKRKVIRVESEENQRLRLWDAGNQSGRSKGSSLCAECPQRATRIHLFL